MATPQQLQDRVKNLLRNPEIVTSFFERCELTPFPEGEIRRLFPDLVDEWEIIGQAYSVPWVWVMLQELAISSFLSPTAILFPTPSIRVFCMVWWFILHPGSTGTSQILRTYGEVYDILEARANADRRQLRKEWNDANMARNAADRSPTTANPYHGEVNMVMGSGSSIEGEGKIAAKPQNVGRTCGFMSEGKRFFKWLTQEGGQNEAIVVELYERRTWRRYTINDDRSFVIPFPSFQAIGGVHLQDIMEVYVGDDALGVQGRAGFVYTRPAFKRAREIRSASVTLQQSRFSLEEHLADIFQRAYNAHTPGSPGTPDDQFVRFKEYPFRVYTLTPEAEARFSSRFDNAVQLQEDSYGIDQQKSKFYGKAKTRDMPGALAFHILREARLGHQGATWDTAITANSMEASEILTNYFLGMNENLQGFFADLIARVSSVGSSPTAPGGIAGVATGPAGSRRAAINSYLDTTFATFTGMEPEIQGLLHALATTILQNSPPWTDTPQLASMSGVRMLLGDRNEHTRQDILARACGLLKLLNLVSVAVTTRTHGPPIVYMAKRPLLVTDADYLHALTVLREFGINPGTYICAPSMDAVTEHKPPHAAVPDFYVTAPGRPCEEKIQLLRSMKLVSPRLPLVAAGAASASGDRGAPLLVALPPSPSTSAPCRRVLRAARSGSVDLFPVVGSPAPVGSESPSLAPTQRTMPVEANGGFPSSQGSMGSGSRPDDFLLRENQVGLDVDLALQQVLALDIQGAQAAIAIRNVFHLQVMRARNVETLHGMVEAQRRQDTEIGVVTARIVSLIEQRIPKQSVINVMDAQNYDEAHKNIWKNWVDVGLLHYNSKEGRAADQPWPEHVFSLPHA